MCCCPLLEILYTEFVYFFAPQDICQYVCQAKVLILMRRYVFLYAWANKNEFLIRNGNGGTERVS